MKKNTDMPIRLCGGTLLTVLLSFKRAVLKKPAEVMGRSSFLSQHDFIYDLLRIMRPNHDPYNQDTFRTQSSRYKNCIIDGGSDIPFHDAQYVSSYENRIQDEYFRVAMEMNDLIAAYLDILSADQTMLLARSVLGLLASDHTVDSDTYIHALPDGSMVKIEDLLQADKICVSSLLIGMLLYVAKYVPDNKSGQETITAWRGTGLDPVLTTLSSSVPRIIDAQLYVPAAAPVVNDMESREEIDASYIARFSGYLQDLYTDFSTVPSFFQGEPVEFESFYVSPNLVKKSLSGQVKVMPNMPNPTQESLLAYSRLVAIYGMGGLGKSLLARHVLLTAINDFPKTGVVPFFAELRQYRRRYRSLEEFLYKRSENLWGHSPDALSVHLTRNPTLVLLDGMDEIKEEFYRNFEKNLDSFLHKYKKAQIVVTSRKVENRILRQFATLDLAMLTLPQAKEVIRKISVRKDADPELCESFIGKLDGLYFGFDRYVGNPLLLSIMLLTYTETGGILSGKMYRFFEEAYYALSSRHDTVHKKGFRRAFYTGLSAKNLKTVISEFCASGYNDWNFTFTAEQISFYLKDMFSYEGDDIPAVEPDAFIMDMKNSLSLMYESSLGRYTFYHRSFQEYFAAHYIFSLEDSELYEESQMFEKGYSSYNDSTFSMFYEMSPERIKKYVFLPLLRDLFEKCESADGCLTYLATMYDMIPFQVGDVEEEIWNPTTSLRLSFILRLTGFHEELTNTYVPLPPGYAPEDRFFKVDDEEGGRMVVKESQLQWKYGYGPENLPYVDDISEICDGHPEEAGCTYLINTRDLLDKKYKAAADFLTGEKSPYRNEYDQLKAYYLNLEKECHKPRSRRLRSLAS